MTLGWFASFVILSAQSAVFNVKDYGAVGDGRTSDTSAIRDACAACAAAQGGTVLFPPPGIYLTGSFSLPSHSTLKVEKDATIKATTNSSEFALIDALPSYPIGGGNTQPRFAALISATNFQAVAIAGGGVIDGSGVEWHRDVQTSYTRPCLLEFLSGSGLTISEVDIVDGAYYHIHPYNCSNVLIDRVSVVGVPGVPHNDGIDPDSSVNVVISNSFILSGDDHISIKSGKAWPGKAVNLPSANITIVNNTLSIGAGLAIGSETSGGVWSVYIFNNTLTASENLVRMKSCPYYGGVVQDITYDSNWLTLGASAIFVNQHYECSADNTSLGMTVFRNIQISNTKGDTLEAGEIQCAMSGSCTDFTMTNVQFNALVGYVPCGNITGVVENCNPVPCFGLIS